MDKRKLSFGALVALSFFFLLSGLAYADSTIPVSNITVTAKSAVDRLPVGETLQMLASIFPDTATDPSVTWSVTNGTGSATINSNGLLTGTAAGDVCIIATANDGSGITGEYTVTIVHFTGNGTADDPYRICNAADLSRLASLVNAGKIDYSGKYYEQTQNIDLSSIAAWTPIGNYNE
jgi:hypothetical protein